MDSKTEKWPRLTETLPKCTERNACRACGQIYEDGATLQLWQECDDQDKPQLRWLWVCEACEKKVITAHPRLYIGRTANSPAPGAMKICWGCSFSNQSRCDCPTASANGGTGIIIKTSPPISCLVDGTRNGRRTGWRETLYFHPPSHCNGRNPPV